MSARSESNRGRFRFWVTSAVAIAGIGFIAFLVFLLITKAVYAWGFFGGFLFIAVLFLIYGWIYDRRRKPSGDDD